MSSSDRSRSLSHPALWPTWVGIRIFRQLCKLPWTIQTWLGKTMGSFVFHGIRLRRHVVDVNLKLCFPELDDAGRRKLAKAHYQALGMGIFETGLAWWGTEKQLPPCRIEGREHLEAATSNGRGVLLLTAHFTTLEICGRFFCDKFAMGGLYREPDNRVIALEMRRRRIVKLVPAIRMDDIRGLLRALKNGSTIWYAPDQGKKGKFSSILPFFGVPALTNTATSRIAAMSGAAVIPYFGIRKPDGSYLLKILPALENFPSDDAEEDAIRINRIFEENIRLNPEQYFWVHKRFKRRGKDFSDVYRGG